jgi:hypothetical protein
MLWDEICLPIDRLLRTLTGGCPGIGSRTVISSLIIKCNFDDRETVEQIEVPFTTFHAEGVVGLFDKKSIVGLLSILRQIDANAAA